VQSPAPSACAYGAAERSRAPLVQAATDTSVQESARSIDGRPYPIVPSGPKAPQAACVVSNSLRPPVHPPPELERVNLTVRTDPARLRGKSAAAACPKDIAERQRECPILVIGCADVGRKQHQQDLSALTTDQRSRQGPHPLYSTCRHRTTGQTPPKGGGCPSGQSNFQSGQRSDNPSGCVTASVVRRLG
jgi:hypothetical protein